MTTLYEALAVLLSSLGGVGLLKLLWPTLIKGAAWLASYPRRKATESAEAKRAEAESRRADAETKRVEIDATRVGQDERISEATLLAKKAQSLDERTMSLMTHLEARITSQDQSITRIEARLAEESEKRELAMLSAQAAHIRADEADESRQAALSELASLRTLNAELQQQLDEAKSAAVAQARANAAERARDRQTIESLQEHLSENFARIGELEQKIHELEHGTFEMKFAESTESEGTGSD